MIKHDICIYVTFVTFCMTRHDMCIQCYICHILYDKTWNLYIYYMLHSVWQNMTFVHVLHLSHVVWQNITLNNLLHLHLRNRLLDQGYKKICLIRSLKKFIFRYQDLVEIYSVSTEKIINDGFSYSENV